MAIIEIPSLPYPPADMFFRLTDAQLRSRQEPEKGILIAIVKIPLYCYSNFIHVLVKNQSDGVSRFIQFPLLISGNRHT